MKNVKTVKKDKKIVSFFDFPLSKKKEIILAAAKGSNELQLELVKEYELKIKKNRD